MIIWVGIPCNSIKFSISMLLKDITQRIFEIESKSSAFADTFLFFFKIQSSATLLRISNWKSFISFVLRHRRWRKLIDAAGKMSARILAAVEFLHLMAHALRLMALARDLVWRKFFLQASEVEEDLPAQVREGLHNTVASFCACAEVRYPAKVSICLTLAPFFDDGFVEIATFFRVLEKYVSLVSNQDACQLLFCQCLTHFFEPVIKVGKLLGNPECCVVQGYDQNDTLHIPVIELDERAVDFLTRSVPDLQVYFACRVQMILIFEWLLRRKR